MHIIEEMESRIEGEESMFQAQLLREDVARLRKLTSLAQSEETFEAYAKKGLYIGWTQGDIHTHQLKDTINTVMTAVHAYETGGRDDEQDRAVREAWAVFHRTRLEKLVHCL